MPYGKQAKEELANLVQGKCVRILVYEQDRYGRYVGDVYCNDIFAQVFTPLQIYSLLHDKSYHPFQGKLCPSVGSETAVCSFTLIIVPFHIFVSIS